MRERNGGWKVGREGEVEGWGRGLGDKREENMILFINFLFDLV